MNSLSILLSLAVGGGNLLKFSFFSLDVNVSLLDVVIFLLNIVFVISLVNRKYSPARIYGHFKNILPPIIAFALISLLSLLVSGSQFGAKAVVVGFFYWLRWINYSLAFIPISFFIPAGRIKGLMYTLGFLVAIIGLGQYILFPDVRHLSVSEWDPHYYRVVGSFLDPGFTGIVLVFTLIFLMINPVKKQAFHWVIWSLTYLSFALTYSRSSYLAFLVGMAYVSHQKRSWKLFLAILVLFISTLLLLPRAPQGEGVKLERTSSIEARIINWSQSLQIISQHPVLGVGYNTYRYAQRKFNFLDNNKWLVSHAGAGADSSLLFIAATTGLIGLSVYLWYISRLSKVPGLSVYLAALLVHSLFLNSLVYPAVMLWLALVIASSLNRNSTERS